MEENGALYIVCKEQQIVWSSENSFRGAEGLYLESDGHAVIYKDDGKVIWTFLVEGSKPKAEKLVLQNDGNLVLRANDQSALWVSGSNEKCLAGIHIRNTHPEVFLRKSVQQITGEHPYRSAISMKLLCNFIEITPWHGCSPVNLLHIFRTPFPKNTSK